jgi:hypothetical protein
LDVLVKPFEDLLGVVGTAQRLEKRDRPVVAENNLYLLHCQVVCLAKADFLVKRKFW